MTMLVLLTGRGYLHTVSTHISMRIHTLASTQEDCENDLGSLFTITIYRFIFSNIYCLSETVVLNMLNTHS